MPNAHETAGGQVRIMGDRYQASPSAKTEVPTARPSTPRSVTGASPRARVSVALCTCNGSNFLGEQLASIAAQTRLPDELVIFDDHSDDDSPAIARRFARVAPFAVEIRENPRRLGCRGNFEACIAACSGEIIVLSDQDDVWLPHKLERLTDALSSNPEAAFAFSDALMVDRELRPIPFSLWQAIRFTTAERRRFQHRRGFEVLLRRDVVTGATMAFQASYRELLLPIPPGWIHDAWIALLLSAVAWGVALDEPLIQYRQHSRQQIGERRRGIYQQYLIARTKTHDDFRRRAAAWRVADERVRERAAGAEAAAAELCEKALHAERRARMHERGARRWPLILHEWWAGNYGRYSPGWKALAQDVFL